LLFSLVLIFLWFRPSVSSTGRTTHEVVLDALLICGSIAAVGYLFIEHDYVLTRFYYVDDLRLADAILGVMLILLVLEASRRTVGLALPLTAVVFLVYAIYPSGVDWTSLIDQMYLTTEGIFGIPLNVSATYMVLF